MYFTITFRSFTPTPGALEFSPGQEYYFISTSTNTDIHRRVGGWCSSHNMKMIFKVAEREENSATGNSPLINALKTSTTRRVSSTPSPYTTTRKVPVYYYKSRTPSVSTSDYIYYYSPRDLIQLKLAAKRHGASLNTDNKENVQAAPLTASAGNILPGTIIVLTTILTLGAL